MSDTLTVLSSSNSNQLAKTFIGFDMSFQEFNPGTFFSVEERPVSDLESLASVLKSLESEPTKTVIRGTLSVSDAGRIKRSKENFRPTSRQWCMIDIDSLWWDGGIQDREAMISHAVSQLPAEFQGVDFWYHFSSSMGIKLGIRVHLWYWLERPCSDDEMKTWLTGCPVDLKLFDSVQIHLTANPQFIDGAVDPYPDRSGLHEVGIGLASVPVPEDLDTRTSDLRRVSTPRSRTATGMLDPEAVIRSPETGLAIDGREQLMFLLSNEVMAELVTGTHTPSEDDVTEALWSRFKEEADLSVVNDRGPWTDEVARSKVRARLRELENGTYSFVSRSGSTTLVAGSGNAERPTLISATEAQEKLDTILKGFFQDLSEGQSPRAGVRITMGAGKTKQTIKRLKSYLSERTRQNIEVYVPRHDLASEWEENLHDVNAKVVHVYPRTGGDWDQEANAYEYPIKCQRADYVRDLEAKGHSIYSKACLSRSSGERCSHFSECEYLDQFRALFEDRSSINTVRIYSHASLFLNRNELERDRVPDLVIIDESFLSSAVGNLLSLSTAEITEHLRTDGHSSLGFDLVECISRHQGSLAYLKEKGIGSLEFRSVPLDHLSPSTEFEPDRTQSRDVRSAKLYRKLQLLIDHVTNEIEDEEKERFEQLAYDDHKNEVVICEHKPCRVPRSVPVLYLDATADPIITKPYLPELEHHRIDVRQLAVVSQVHDRTGSNTFWKEKIPEEERNLGAAQYDAGQNDISRLVVVLNAWVNAGESPLIVGNKKLCDFLRGHQKLDDNVAIAHFNSLRGTNEFEGKSVIFITGRHQPPLDDLDRQARAIFGTSGYPLTHETYDEMPTDQVEYWLSERSGHAPSAVTLKTFSDPRIAAMQKQVREAETVQAIARLRLVWASYQKRVFLLSNLPVEMPVDHLIGFEDLMPDKLELELLDRGDVPISANSLRKLRPDLGLTQDAARKVISRSNASDPRSMLSALPDLVRACALLATFRAGDINRTKQKHVFLPKNFKVFYPENMGEPAVVEFDHWNNEEILHHLEAGWGDGQIQDLEVDSYYQPVHSISD